MFAAHPVLQFRLPPVYPFPVATANDREQRERVRQRFTRTAEQFARFSLSTRAEEAELLVSLVMPRGDERALDLACGPGTFTRAFAPRVRFIFGLDLTAALLVQARAAAATAGLCNLAFSGADAAALPLPAAALDVAVCAYSLHHFADPAAALAELARVVRPGGRVALMDIVAPDDPARAEANNRIERARDASHTTTLRATDARELVAAAGLRLLEMQFAERPRSFDDWMQIAGWASGDSAYAATRRLMEESIPGDTAGFRPRRVTAAEPSPVAASGDLEFLQASFLLLAEKGKSQK